MKVTRISIYKYERPFRFKFHNTQTLRTSAESIVVRLEFNNGISGYGESTPMSYITGEDSSTVVQVLQNCFSPILLSREMDTIDHIESLLDELENECLSQNILQYNSALGAVDIALLDALGEYQQIPLTAFLGSIVREKAPYSISVPFLPLEKIEELFYHLPQIKIKYVKILVGENEIENIQRVRLVRSLFGDNVDIRVENNGMWTFPQAISNLEKIQKYNITAVEQPIVKDDIKGLQRLKKAIKIPIVVDESMCSLSDAKHLIEQEACDILNIKISKCGGLLRSKQIAKFALSHNILCQMGAHVGETEILRAAGESFALTTPNLIYFEGASFLLFKDIWRDDQFEITKKDAISRFGLGIESAQLESVMGYCVPVVELTHNGRSGAL
jgi:L-alanine-DL-glutamate epimerase-like enolase superfamily enzyme